MRVMTLNIWQGRLKKVLLNHLDTLDIDVACIQEAVDYDGVPGGLVTTSEKIGGSLQTDYQFFSELTSIKFGSGRLSFGNAIYSKVPFAETETVFTNGEYTEDFDFGKDDYNVRAFQHVAVEHEGKQLHLINHHGHHIDAHKLGDAETLRQVQQILEYMQKLDGAIILCGDFNLSPESESIQQFDSMLRNLAVEHSLTTTRSKLTPKNEVCDYIFVNDQVKVNDFTMDASIVSDHNALILDFDLK